MWENKKKLRKHSPIGPCSQRFPQKLIPLLLRNGLYVCYLVVCVVLDLSIGVESLTFQIHVGLATTATEDLRELCNIT